MAWGGTLIAGCGYVGRALALQLRDAGAGPVFGLRREPGEADAGVDMLRADLGSPADLAALPDAAIAAERVVYAVGAKRREEGAYRAAYVDGLRNLLSEIDRRGARPRRVLFTSSTSVYAQSAGERVDESSAAEPASFTGRILREAEDGLAASGHPFCVVRLGGIYGPGRTRLVDRVRSGQARLRGRIHYTNRIHRDDAAGAIAHLLERPDPDELILGVDTEPADEADVLRWLAAELGVAPPPTDAAADAGAGGPTGKRCSSARLVASGYAFRYPTFREGYRALIRAASP